MNKLNEGLGYALVFPLFILFIPISISFVILYVILRDKKQSFVGSILGLIGAFVVAYAIPVHDGQGIIWLLMDMDIVGQSPLAPFIMAVFLGMLTAFMGLIIIKLGMMKTKRKTIAGVVIIVLLVITGLNIYQFLSMSDDPALMPDPIPLPVSADHTMTELEINEVEATIIDIKEIEDIGSGTYFEITDDELKEYPELIRAISGEGCTNSSYGSWYCELSSDEDDRLSDLFDMKHSEYLFSIDMEFENNLNDNIIDAELMNKFESNGFPLSENHFIDTREKNSLYDSWWIFKKPRNPEYVIWEINDELQVYKSGYIEYQFTKIGGHYYEILFVVT